MEKIFKLNENLENIITFSDKNINFNYPDYDINYNIIDNTLSLTNEMLNIEIEYVIKKITINNDEIFFIHDYNINKNNLSLMIDDVFVDYPEYMEIGQLIFLHEDQEYIIKHKKLGMIYYFNMINENILIADFEIYNIAGSIFSYTDNNYEKLIYKYQFSNKFIINIQLDNKHFEIAYNYNDWSISYIKILNKIIFDRITYRISIYKENDIVDVEMERNDEIINLRGYHELISKDYHFIVKNNILVDKINKLLFEDFYSLVIEMNNNYINYI